MLERSLELEEEEEEGQITIQEMSKSPGMNKGRDKTEVIVVQEEITDTKMMMIKIDLYA